MYRRVVQVLMGGLAVAVAAPAWAGSTERVSVGPGGRQADGDSFFPSISADGRFVAFYSYATNLVPGDTNGQLDGFVRDRLKGTTERVSVGPGGRQGDGPSSLPSISGDGRFVTFRSGATNLVSGDTNGRTDVFVRDRLKGTTERVSVSSSGAQGDDDSDWASISSDGRFVAFMSAATNLVKGDTNRACDEEGTCSPDVFVRDRLKGTTERVSVSSSGKQTSSGSFSYFPSISGDGRFVAFGSDATNLVPGDTNREGDIFVRDRV